MPKYVIEIGATRTETFVGEVELDVPAEIAEDPDKFNAWIQEHEDSWHEEVMDNATGIGPFENVTPVILRPAD